MDERMMGEVDEVATVDPLASDEAPVAAPPLMPAPPTPVPDPEPIPLDDPGEPVITQPDRPDLDLAEPLGDPDAAVDLPPVDPTGPPPAADPGGLMMQALARLDALEASLGRRLDGLQASIERENRAEASREKVVDRLHAELQEAKQGFVLNILRPVLMDLIKLHDDMGKMADAHTARPSDGAEVAANGSHQLVRALRDYQQEVEDILYRQGVEPFRAEGETFDPRRQRGLTTVATPDPAQARLVANRVRPGFQVGEKVIRPEIVAVYAHKPG